MGPRLAACLFAGACACLTVEAAAQAPAPKKPDAKAEAAKKPPPEPTDAPIGSDEKRPVPDYDARGDDPTTVGDVLIWVPRILFSPLYFVSEFVVRRPLGWAISTAEEKDIPQRVVDLFTFGPEGNIGIVPTGLIDFGLRPSVGIYFFYNDFLAKENKLRARVAFGGTDWLYLNLADRVEVMKHHELGVRGEFGYRPDYIFHGLGPESSKDRARYKSTRREAGFNYHGDLWRSSSFDSFVAVRRVTFDPTVGAFDEPTVADQIAAGKYPPPPGIADGYTILTEGFSAALDTRKLRNLENAPEGSDFVSPPGTGVKLAIRGEHAGGLTDAPQPTLDAPRHYQWVRYGATLGGYVDLTGEQRVLGLTLVGDFADPLRDGGEIPFTEQITLGGARPLRGFLEGRLIDRSAAAAVLEYQWPIWVYLDGSMHYALGNVFGEHLDGFELGLLRQSFGIGFRGTGHRDHSFEVLLAFGTKTFDGGGEIESVRFVLGATSGF